jgi:hypothetical protein
VEIAFSWNARQPVRSRNIQYRFSITFPRNCGGEGGSTFGTAPGPSPARSATSRTSAPGGSDFTNELPGGSLLVGHLHAPVTPPFPIVGIRPYTENHQRVRHRRM